MKPLLPILLAFLTAAALPGRAMAADAAADFGAANKLYAQGKFTEAGALYRKMIQSGAISPALYFNYGNAEFKSGHLGSAIAAYRRAAQLAPRDAEVRANLEFARNQVQGPALRERRWEAWLGTFSLNEWTALAAAAFWLLFGWFAAMQIRPTLKRARRSVTPGMVIVIALLFTGLGLDALIHFNKPVAVIVVPEATARSGPFDDAQNTFTVRDGAELAVLDRRNDWLEVTDGSGRIGWLPGQQAEVLPGS